jgi:hypothetical protein
MIRVSFGLNKRQAVWGQAMAREVDNRHHSFHSPLRIGLNEDSAKTISDLKANMQESHYPNNTFASVCRSDVTFSVTPATLKCVKYIKLDRF